MKMQALGDIQLASGDRLPGVEVAYVQYGQLDEQGTNAVLVTHGYTSGPSMLSPDHHTAEGSWAPLMGSGRPLDTDRFCIICSNMLGSSFGTTGPSSPHPGDGQPWGSRFPAIELTDIVAVQHRLLVSLGVRHLKAVLGPSYGGWQALQWALQYPDWMDGIGVVVSGLTHPPGFSAASQRERFSASPEWHDGDYYRWGGMRQTMHAFRLKTMQDYGLERLYVDRFPHPQERQARMQLQCQQWADRFDPHSMIALAGAAERFDVRERIQDIRCKLWHAVCTSDKIFPPDAATTQRLRALRVPLRLQEINSPYGHMASGVEWRALEEPMRWLLDPDALA